MVANYTNLPKTEDEPLGGAYGIYDPETLNYRDLLISQHSKFFFTPQNAEIIKNEFFKTYIEWMFRPHNVNGFKKFNNVPIDHDLDVPSRPVLSKEEETTCFLARRYCKERTIR